MEQIVGNIYRKHSVEIPVKKVILTRNGYIDYPNAPVDTIFIDKRSYNEWFTALRKLSSPIKHVQLKAAKFLVEYCQTTYVKRTDWETM